jgi:integrase
MKGHIRERSPCHFAIILDIRDPETGKRRRKWHSFRGTKREAQIECSRLVTEFAQGDYLEPSKTTLEAFLERWLTQIEPRAAPRTFERYSEIIRKNIVPLLGKAIIGKLRPDQIGAAYARALKTGRRDGSGGLSPRTVHHMHRLLKQALATAVRWRVLPHNPADNIDPPKVERTKMKALDPDETARLLSHVRATRMFMPVLLAVMCGLRRGEISALRRSSIEFHREQLSIIESTEQTTKGIRSKETKSGRARTVALPSLVVEELRRHLVQQAEGFLKVGIRLTGKGHVAGREDGYPLQPNSLTHEFNRILAEAADLPRIRFHDLRHTHATHLLSNGVHPKIAQERLGHSSIGITLDLYSHVLPGMQEDAAAKVDATIRAAIDRK